MEKVMKILIRCGDEIIPSDWDFYKLISEIAEELDLGIKK